MILLYIFKADYRRFHSPKQTAADLWGRLLICGRLSIGLLAFPENFPPPRPLFLRGHLSVAACRTTTPSGSPSSSPGACTAASRRIALSPRRAPPDKPSWRWTGFSTTPAQVRFTFAAPTSQP